VYEITLQESANELVQANLVGVKPGDEVGADDFTLNLFKVDTVMVKFLCSMTLGIEGTRVLYEFLRGISLVRNSDGAKEIRFVEVGDHGLSPDLVDLIKGNEDVVLKILAANPEAVAKFVESELKERDVVALAHRRQQLEFMEKLLSDKDFFTEVREQWNVRGQEAVWQRFFEINPWIFGQGLDMIAFGGVSEERLEQITTGATVAEAGKRVDALLATLGKVRSLCFVEIKHHETKLLQTSEYRPETWGPSMELAGAVAQSHKTVQKALRSIGTKLEEKDEDGFPTGELFFNYAPRSYVVAGTTSQFVQDGFIHEAKFSSFEMFRRNLRCPDVVTFDELLERTRLALG